MERRKELKRQYRESKTQAGVYQIRNTKNGMVFIKGTANLKTMNGQRFQLENGSHRNRLIQQDWNRDGSESFVFEVLEVLKEKEEGYFDRNGAIRDMEKKWLEKLQPEYNKYAGSPID